MNRVITLVLLFLAIFLLITRFRKKPPEPKPPPAPSENMVRCAHCGVHLPKGESITAGQQHFCSDAHRLAHMDKTEPS